MNIRPRHPWEPTDEEKVRASESWGTYWYDAQVTMLFLPPLYGSFDWFLKGEPRGGTATIHCSYVFDPLRDIVAWFTTIAAGEIPAVLKVNEEGHYAVFSAASVQDRADWIEMKIERVGDPTGDDDPRLLYLSRVERRQIVKEFLRRWNDWVENDYVAKEWHLFGAEGDENGLNPEGIFDPVTIDLSALSRFVSKH